MSEIGESKRSGSAAATASGAETRSSTRRRSSPPSRDSRASRSARLADAVGMSKSGLFAHFGSKEELQLATIETASVDLRRRGRRSRSQAEPTGIGRLRALAERFLDHVERQVFPGGCFFASVAAEMDTHPGPVRDKAIDVVVDWSSRLVAAARAAQEEGAIEPGRGRRAARVRARCLPVARERRVRDQRRRRPARSCPPCDRPPPRRSSAAVVIQSGRGGTGRSGGTRAASARLIPSSSAR